MQFLVFKMRNVNFSSKYSLYTIRLSLTHVEHVDMCFAGVAYRCELFARHVDRTEKPGQTFRPHCKAENLTEKGTPA